jgi:hypothetical protein
MSQQPNLSSLAAGQQRGSMPMKTSVHHEVHEVTDSYGHRRGGFAWAFLWFAIVAVLVWIILYSLKPNWILKSDDKKHRSGNMSRNDDPSSDDVDGGKLFFASICIAIVVVIILWLLKSAGHHHNGGHHSSGTTSGHSHSHGYSSFF